MVEISFDCDAKPRAPSVLSCVGCPSPDLHCLVTLSTSTSVFPTELFCPFSWLGSNNISAASEATFSPSTQMGEHIMGSVRITKDEPYLGREVHMHSWRWSLRVPSQFIWIKGKLARREGSLLPATRNPANPIEGWVSLVLQKIQFFLSTTQAEAKSWALLLLRLGTNQSLIDRHVAV